MAGKTRSPNYPALGLSASVDLAQKLWKKEQRTPVSPEVAVKAFGYNSLSGPARVALGALGKYGLLDKTAHGIRLSDLALQILHPESAEARQQAIREAALRPDLFRELSQTHAQASDDALRSYLITKRKFAEAGARGFIAAFRDTLSLANSHTSGYSAANGAKEPDRMADPGTGVVLTPATGKTTAIVQSFSWPLAKGVTAEVRFSGSHPVTAVHLERLRQYLELAKDAVDADGDDA